MSGKFLGILTVLQIVAAGSGVAGPSAACVAAARAAERHWALPANLLLAIGRVESGRPDPATGQVLPWPWSANAAGHRYVFASAGEAATVVRFLREFGIASIDVGCFQVNLRHHPDAFGSVAAGFDPYANADYAARFLRTLFGRTGSWTAAVADYHSAHPYLGAEYRGKVLRVWHGLPLQRADNLANRGSGDPHVILNSAAAERIQIFTSRTLPAALRSALTVPNSGNMAQR